MGRRRRRSHANKPDKSSGSNDESYTIFVHGRAVSGTYEMPSQLRLPDFDAVDCMRSLVAEAKLVHHDLSKGFARCNGSPERAFDFYNATVRCAHANPDQVFSVFAVTNDEYSNVEAVCKYLNGLHCATRLASLPEPTAEQGRHQIGAKKSVLHGYVWRGEDYVALADLRTPSQLRQCVSLLLGLSEDECPVCFESMLSNSAESCPLFECGHMCCLRCWCASLDKCPVCRCTSYNPSSAAIATTLRANSEGRNFTPEEKRVVDAVAAESTACVPLQSIDPKVREEALRQIVASVPRREEELLPGELETMLNLLLSLHGEDAPHALEALYRERAARAE